MKEKSPEEKIKDFCKKIRNEISTWKHINKNGCNDPFWPDGCNMNLVRNHIIYYRHMIVEICEENHLQIPEECYLSLPPEVDNNYMSNRKQKERVKRLGYMQKLVRGKYEYDEQQMSLFDV